MSYSDRYLLAVAMPDCHPWQQWRRELHNQTCRRLTIGMHLTMVPPFLAYSLEELAAAVAKVTRRTRAIVAKMNGLKIFAGSDNAVVIPVTAPALTELHNRLEEVLRPMIVRSGEVLPFEPHLTLISGLTPDQCNRVMDTMANRRLTGEWYVRNLTLYRQAKTDVGAIWKPVPGHIWCFRE